MPLMEYVFRIGSRGNLLCEFTRAHKGSRVFIQYLRGDVADAPKWALFTFLGPRPLTETLLTERFDAEYGMHEVVATGDDSVSVRVPYRLGDTHGGRDPLMDAVRILGPDTAVHPVLVQDGHIHVSLVSPSPNGREAFMAWTKTVRSRLPPDDFKLLHVRPYDPAVTLLDRSASDDITSRQEEIIKMAIALGYYEDPRRCTLEDLAEMFGVSKAAIHKRLTAAENTIIKRFYHGP